MEESEWKQLHERNNDSLYKVIESSKFQGVFQILHTNIKIFLDERSYYNRSDVDDLHDVLMQAIRDLAASNGISLNSAFTTWHAIEKLAAIAERLAEQRR